MNKYQQQVADIDARHHRRVRAITFLGATVIAVVILWTADVRIGDWRLSQTWSQMRDWWRQDWFPEKDERYAVAPQLPTPVVADDSQPKESTKPLLGTDSSISKMPLPLILVRTEPGRNEMEGLAFMGSAKENPQTYMAGAILANGARITQVHRDHVVLERDGKSVKLYVDGSEKNRTASNDMLTVGGQKDVALVKLKVSESITDYILTSPNYDSNAIRGYRVYAGKKSGVFQQLGLRQGDVVVALNGQPLVDHRQAVELFEQLMRGIAMTAAVERGGQSVNLTLDGAVISTDRERVKQNASNPPPSVPLGPGV